MQDGEERASQLFEAYLQQVLVDGFFHADPHLRFKVDAFDEVHLMEGLQKIANRITLGLALAALIVSAAMMMRVETDFTLFGYPGLAIILFTAAVAGGGPGREHRAYR